MVTGCTVAMLSGLGITSTWYEVAAMCASREWGQVRSHRAICSTGQWPEDVRTARTGLLPRLAQTSRSTPGAVITLNLFVPAAFDLYEFDDRNVPTGRGAPRKRWFSHWDGLVGAPAEEVALGWSAGDAVAIVCTSGRHYDRAEARFRAAHLALGGDALPLGNRPEGPLATNQAINLIGSSPDLWTEAGDGADPGRTTESAISAGFSIGYRKHKGGFVFIAAVNIDPALFNVHMVDDWSVYDVDPRSTFPLSALNR